MILGRRFVAGFATALVLALLPPPTMVSARAVAAQKGKATPSYVLQTLAVPAGYTRASALAINDRHEVVGTAGFGSSPRAVYWSSVDTPPVLLPCLTDPCGSEALAINTNGIIAGNANDQAVLWRWNGLTWSVEGLPYPGSGDPDYRSHVSALLDDGTAAGFYQLWMGIMYPNDIPVRWFPSGALTEYPVPPEYFSGRALRVNPDGDAVGELRANDGRDPTWVYGVIWAHDGTSYATLVLPSLLNGITPRFADGSFMASSTAGRIRVSPSPGGWTHTVDSRAGGPGLGINRLGDMVGTLSKKGATVPYLFTIDGKLTQMPLPAATDGGAGGVSADRWLAGDISNKQGRFPAVWRPQ